MNVRRLTMDDAESYAALRAESLANEPLAFASSPGDDSVAALRPDLIVYGAFADDRLIGIAGLHGDRHVKAAHKAHVWGMYVMPSHRGRGIAAALLDAVIAHARRLDGVTAIHLGVTSAAAAAKRVYERAGFMVWGREPGALRVGETTVDQDHMVLPLAR